MVTAWWRRDWSRPSPTARQRRADAGLAIVAAVVAVVVVEIYRSWLGADLGWRGVEAYGWFALAGLLLAMRRGLPLVTLLAESAVFIVVGERMTTLGTTFPIQMILFTSLYSAWAWSRRPTALRLTSAAVLVAMFGWLLWSLLQPGVLPEVDRGGYLPPAASALVYNVLINIVYFFGAIAWGHTAWRGARERAAADQQTRLELALGEQLRERAVAEERVRIARDLHDVVAHHVSGIGVQAAGAQRALRHDPQAAEQALGTIAGSAREAVSQMHELVHLLREPGGADDDGRAPRPGLDDLPALQSAEGPVAIEHRVVGEPFVVPPTTSQSLFRIAQEAVTNVRRHAGARHASVVLRYVEQPRAVEVEIVDDGRGARPAAAEVAAPARRGAGARGGFGLTGIRERAALHGGEAEIGDRPQGGFRVRVRIPVGSAAPR